MSIPTDLVRIRIWFSLPNDLTNWQDPVASECHRLLRCCRLNPELVRTGISLMRGSALLRWSRQACVETIQAVCRKNDFAQADLQFLGRSSRNSQLSPSQHIFPLPFPGIGHLVLSIIPSCIATAMLGTSASSSSPPALSTTLSISPSAFHLSSENSQEPPIITLEVTSHAHRPITIFTWPTIFNLDLSQRRASFVCLDLTADEPLHLELTKGPKRPAFSRRAGGRDDAHFHTLEPETPVRFCAQFKLAKRMTEAKGALVPEHRYRFAVSEDERVAWWRYGTRADVLTPMGHAAELGPASGPPLALDGIAAIEFRVLKAVDLIRDGALQASKNGVV
nr:hypothetical protein CFP56_22130 [Quercus suber]